jgi:hypothetical protein
MAPPASQFFRLPVIGGGMRMKPAGQWHTVVMDLVAACAGSRRYTFHRALFTRLVGSLDIQGARLHTRPVRGR